MNLRSVHAGVILFSAALAVLFGIWCLTQNQGTGGLIAALVAFAIGVGLVVYDSWFLRKTRTLR